MEQRLASFPSIPWAFSSEELGLLVYEFPWVGPNEEKSSWPRVLERQRKGKGVVIESTVSESRVSQSIISDRPGSISQLCHLPVVWRVGRHPPPLCLSLLSTATTWGVARVPADVMPATSLALTTWRPVGFSHPPRLRGRGGGHWASPACDPKLRVTGFSLQVSHLPPTFTAPCLVVRKPSSQKLKPSQGDPWSLSLFTAKKEPNGPLSREPD